MRSIFPCFATTAFGLVLLSGCPSPTPTPTLNVSNETPKPDPDRASAASLGLYVINCILPSESYGATFQSLAPEVAVIDKDNRLRALVLAPEGVGLVTREGQNDQILRWELAVSGDRCTLEDAPSVRVRGRIVDETGARVPGATLSGCGATAISDDAGAFQATLMISQPWTSGADAATCLLTATDEAGRAGHYLLPLLGSRPSSIRMELRPTHIQAQSVALHSVLGLPPDPASAPTRMIPSHQGFIELLQGQRSSYTVPPHTVAEIRAALPPGTIATYEEIADDKPRREVTWTFGEQTDEGVKTTVSATEAGEQAVPPRTHSLTWRNLRYKNSFERSSTELSQRSAFTPFGAFTGTHYLASADGKTVISVQTADKLPGLALSSQTLNEGKVTYSLKLLTFTLGHKQPTGQ